MYKLIVIAWNAPGCWASHAKKVHSYRSLYTERARTGMCVDCVSMLQILVANDPIRSHQVRIWVGSAIEG
jgi:hypothetical protein